MLEGAPLKALSIQQPWAWLIVEGHKAIENRGWWTAHRGRTLIHTGRQVDGPAIAALRAGRHPATGDALRLDLPDAWPTGGTVGEADVHGCVTRSADPWFVGPYGFLLRDARPVPFRPCNGRLGFFRPVFLSPVAAGTRNSDPPDLFTSGGPEE